MRSTGTDPPHPPGPSGPGPPGAVDEPAARRPGFVDGRRVTLADGRNWALPPRDPSRADPECDALLSALLDAEDRPESLRAGLALLIFLLDRNYSLGPADLSALLTFPPGDPA